MAGLQVMEVLKSMAGSIDPRAPMRVIKFSTFVQHGRIPRSNDKKTVLLTDEAADLKVGHVFWSFFPSYCAKALPCLSRLPEAALARLLICARNCWRGAGCVHLAPVVAAVAHQGGV